MRKSTSLLLSLVLIILIAAACGNTDKPNGQAGASSTPAPTPTATTQPVDPAKQSKEMTVYYTDTELTELFSQQVEVDYQSEKELIQKALTSLQQGAPEGKVALWKSIHILSVEVDQGAVTIDVHLPDEARLGAPGEALIIESLEKTLFQFDFVQSYDLLVTGEQVDSLMGHVELEHPKLRTSTN